MWSTVDNQQNQGLFFPSHKWLLRLFKVKFWSVFFFLDTAPPKTNMSPEKWGLEDDPFPFKWSLFRGHSFIFDVSCFAEVVAGCWRLAGCLHVATDSTSLGLLRFDGSRERSQICPGRVGELQTIGGGFGFWTFSFSWKLHVEICVKEKALSGNYETNMWF